MGKYDRFSQQAQMRERPWAIHPIWRGIGCIVILIIPILSYAGAMLLVPLMLEMPNLPIRFPRDFIKPTLLPGIGLFPELVQFIPALGEPIPHFYANLIIAGVLMIIGFGLFMIFYTMMYSVAGPRRYGPLDAPPIRGKSKRRR